jgi:hypothetical protein
VVCGVEIDAVLATVVTLADDELCVGEITMDLVVLVTPGEEVLVSDRLLCPVTSGIVPVTAALVSDCVVLLPVVVPVVLDQASAVTNEALTVADRVVVDSVCGMVTEAVLVTDWLVVDLVCVGVSEIV